MKVKITEVRTVGNEVFFPGEVEVKKAEVAKQLKALEAGEDAPESVEVASEEDEKSKSKSRK